MDLFTFILHEADIRQLRDDIKRLQEKEWTAWDPRKFKELAEENLELKLRVGLLVRLLIAKGVFSAEEYANLIAAARSDKS
jgi:hypothetical protein